MAIDRLIAAIDDEDWPFVRDAISKVAKAHDESAPIASPEFHEVWTTKGHRVREQLSNDDLLLDALRKLLPAYTGPGLTLYRGENSGRWKDGACGFAWTPKKDVARMFGRGLNAFHDKGGLLLSTDAPASAIIAGPNEHSNHIQEDEYVVDRRNIKITVEELFPRI